jgi:hypothetical protein
MPKQTERDGGDLCSCAITRMTGDSLSSELLTGDSFATQVGVSCVGQLVAASGRSRLDGSGVRSPVFVKLACEFKESANALSLPSSQARQLKSIHAEIAGDGAHPSVG